MFEQDFYTPNVNFDLLIDWFILILVNIISVYSYLVYTPWW